jgi:hypothetical protein
VRSCVSVRSMSALEIVIPTAKSSMAEIRPALDTFLQQEFPGGMLQRRWEGEILHLSGPGAKGTITFEAGGLVGRADLAPPASLMRPIIEAKIVGALKRAAE